MTWAQRLARVFKIDVTVCERCGGAVKIIACIQNPQLIGRIEQLELARLALRMSARLARGAAS
jgi:hypothetical protein